MLHRVSKVCLYKSSHKQRYLLAYRSLNCRRYNVYVSIYKCECVCVCVHPYVHMCTHSYMCVPIHICVCPSIYVYVYAHLNIYGISKQVILGTYLCLVHSLKNSLKKLGIWNLTWSVCLKYTQSNPLMPCLLSQPLLSFVEKHIYWNATKQQTWK